MLGGVVMNSKKMMYFPIDEKLSANRNFIVKKKYFTPDSEYPFHWHDYFECEIVLEGIAEHRLNDSVYTENSGSAYLLSYLDSHSIRAVSGVEVFSVRFNETLLPPEVTGLLLLGGRSCRCDFDKSEMDYIKMRVERIMAEDEKSEFYDYMVTAIITEIILLIMRKSGVASSELAPNLVQKAQLYTVRNFRNKLSLKSISNELSVTPKYLGQIFKDSIKMSFSDYLNNIRLRYACNLLLTSDLTVKEICFSSGYSSVEYFLDVFRRNCGTTPTMYRKGFRDTE